MKFKNFINNDIEEFRKLNVGIVEDSKEEIVRKIEEEYEIKNEVMDLINHINRLLGKKKIGFTLDENNHSIEKEIKKFNEKKKETIKLKLLETNSILSKMKMELEKKLK